MIMMMLVVVEMMTKRKKLKLKKKKKIRRSKGGYLSCKFSFLQEREKLNLKLKSILWTKSTERRNNNNNNSTSRLCFVLCEVNFLIQIQTKAAPFALVVVVVPLSNLLTLKRTTLRRP